MDERPPDEEDEHGRRLANIVLLLVGALVVAGGVWLVNALIDARNSELCLESGRRNCNPIAIPNSGRDRAD
jgi:hypothetical protein